MEQIDRVREAFALRHKQNAFMTRTQGYCVSTGSEVGGKKWGQEMRCDCASCGAYRHGRDMPHVANALAAGMGRLSAVPKQEIAEHAAQLLPAPKVEAAPEVSLPVRYAAFRETVERVIAREAPKVKAVTDFNQSGVAQCWLSFGGLEESIGFDLRFDSDSVIEGCVESRIGRLRKAKDPLR